MIMHDAVISCVMQRRPTCGLRLGIWISAALVVLVLMGLTWKQCGIYYDAEALWRDTLAKNPQSAGAHNNLANLLLKRNERDKALEHDRLSLEAKPEHNPEASLNLMVALGEQAAIEGRAKDAVQLFQQAIESYPNERGVARAHHSMAIVLMQQQAYAHAAQYFAQSVALDPTPGAYYRLGQCYGALRKWNEAEAAFRRALELDPSREDARRALSALRKLGRDGV